MAGDMTPEQRENIRKWVEALRSGRYEQGTGALRTHKPDGKDQFCCLGVACDVLAPDGWHDIDGQDEEHFGFSFDGGIEYDTPPRGFMRTMLGIDDADPVLVFDDPSLDGMDFGRRATFVNDEMELSFEEIANAIERRFLSDDSSRTLEP